MAGRAQLERIWGDLNGAGTCDGLQDDVDIRREHAHAVEAGDDCDGDPALVVHLASKEQVLGQVLNGEVVLDLHRNSGVQLLLPQRCHVG